jgi:hypothetical protein
MAACTQRVLCCARRSSLRPWDGERRAYERHLTQVARDKPEAIEFYESKELRSSTSKVVGLSHAAK